MRETLQAQDVRNAIRQQIARREKRIIDLQREAGRIGTTPGRFLEIALLVDKLDHANCTLIELEHELRLCGCPDEAYAKRGEA